MEPANVLVTRCETFESFLAGIVGVAVPVLLLLVLRETTDVWRPPLPYKDTRELFRSGPPGTGEGPTLKSVLEDWIGRLEGSSSSSELGV